MSGGRHGARASGSGPGAGTAVRTGSRGASTTMCPGSTAAFSPTAAALALALSMVAKTTRHRSRSHRSRKQPNASCPGAQRTCDRYLSVVNGQLTRITSIEILVCVKFALFTSGKILAVSVRSLYA